jgi:hypothetical protein
LDAASTGHYNESSFFLPAPIGNKLVTMHIHWLLSVLIVVIAGCEAADDAATTPVMTQSVHEHYHVHAADASHGHDHEDDAKLGHDHLHNHAEEP